MQLPKPATLSPTASCGVIEASATPTIVDAQGTRGTANSVGWK